MNARPIPVVTMPAVLTRLLECTAALLFLALTVIVYGHVFSNGMCCADDSTNAIVAKSLALGHGYSNPFPLDGSVGTAYFDPRITTGPALNLPAAAVIYVFGNVPWAPGLASATISLSLLLMTFLVVARLAGRGAAAAYAALVVLSLYAETAGRHFEHWYSLLGEAPAALWCVAGAALLATAPDRRPTVCASSLMYGLALTTKMLALLGVAPVAAWLALRTFSPGADWRRRAVDGVCAGAAFVAPLVVLQTWKIGVLGLQAYQANISEFWRLFREADESTRAVVEATSLWTRALHTYSSNASTMQAHFGYSPIALLIVAGGVGLLVYHHVQERGLRLLFTCLMGGALVHLSWWVLVSTGYPRYALIGQFMYACAVLCAVFAARSWPAVVWTAPLLLLVGVRLDSPGAVQPARFVLRHGFAYTPRVTNLVKTAAFLSTLGDGQPFVMGWWATAVDVEYAMPRGGNFIGSHHVAPGPAQDRRILVRNTVWVAEETTPEFTAWERRCDEVLLDAPPYLVSRCPVSK